MIRINPENQLEIQCKSTSMGHYWFHRYTSEKMGKFLEIEFDETYLFLQAKTEKGIYYSSNGGLTWINDLSE